MGFFNRKQRITEAEQKLADGRAFIAPRRSVSNENAPDDEPQIIPLQMQYKNAYDNFPLVAASVTLTENYVAQEFSFAGPKTSKLDKISKELNLNLHWKRVTHTLLKHGNCWVEMVRTGDGKKGEIERLKILDPLSMHTLRNALGTVIGQIQVVGNKALLWGDFPKEGSKTFDNKPLERVGELNNVIHYVINLQAGEKYGTPPVHSALTALGIKDQIETDMRDVLGRYIAPIIHARVGSDMIPVTDGKIEAVATELEDIYTNTEYVTGNDVEMKVLGFNGKGIDVKPIVEHIDSTVLVAMNTPPVLLGYGASSDRAVAEVNLRTWVVYIKSLRNEMTTQFVDNFIVGQGIAGEEVEILWTHVDERDKLEEIEQIIKIKEAQLIEAQLANDLLPAKFHSPVPEQTIPGMEQPGAKPSLENPTDPTKTTQNTGGSRVNKTDKENPMNANPKKREDIRK